MPWGSSFRPALRPGHRQAHREAKENLYYTPDRNQARMIYYGRQRYNPAIDEIVALFPG